MFNNRYIYYKVYLKCDKEVFCYINISFNFIGIVVYD